jgi:hypothetical protein
MTASVNGIVVYDDLIPTDPMPLDIELGEIHAPILKIELAAETFRGQGDPRDLGLALRGLTLTK